MPRIRTIKPEFWEDEVVGMLSMGARLLYIASWNLADDEGLLRWTPDYLKASVFMYDHGVEHGHVLGFMEELEECGLVFSYIGGKARQRLGWVIKFLKHQKINRAQPGRLPAPSLQNIEIRLAYADRDGWVCNICGGHIERERSVVESVDDWISVDHIQPRSKGGSDYPSNIAATHLRCNKSKRDKDLGYSLNDSWNDSLNDSVNGSCTDSVSDSLPEGKGRERKGSHTVYSEEFEAAWKAYPNRPNNNKSLAWKKWKARIREGVSPDDLIAGVERYLAHCKATDRIGTEYVKQASTFFGPDRWWESDYTISEPDHEPIVLAGQW